MQKPKLRIAAVDFGKKRIGIALSDSRGIIALPLAVVSAGKNLVESTRNVLNCLSPYQSEIKLILVGLPLLLNGLAGEMAKEAEQFAKVLGGQTSIPIELIDERLSSKGADRALAEAQFNRKKRSKHSDETAALLLLQTYLSLPKFKNGVYTE